MKSISGCLLKYVGIGKVFDWIDHKITDGLFDDFASKCAGFRERLRVIQSGQVQHYGTCIICYRNYSFVIFA